MPRIWCGGGGGVELPYISPQLVCASPKGMVFLAVLV